MDGHTPYLSAGLVTASVGWGTKTGFTAGIGVGLPLGGGMSSNLTSAGVSWSQKGGTSISGGGFTYSQRSGDVSYDPSIGYSYGFKYSSPPEPKFYASLGGGEKIYNGGILSEVEITAQREAGWRHATAGQVMAATLMIGAAPVEVPLLLIGAGAVAGAYYLHGVLNPSLRGTHTSTEQPWMEPPPKYFNGGEDGDGPEWPKGSWAVAGAIAAGAVAYEYYDHIDNQNTYYPVKPVTIDKTYVAPAPNPYTHR
jgi:hypothetical protein